jgi:hypothetical protein
LEEFSIDFSGINWIEMRKIGISPDEVVSVFGKPSTEFFFHREMECLVGFTSKRKFILVAFRVAKSINFDIEIFDIDLPYEEDIESIWCRKRKG